MAEESRVNCPVCSKEFPLERINSHIDICLRTSTDCGKSKRRRSSADSQSDMDPQKRVKIVHASGGNREEVPELETDENMIKDNDSAPTKPSPRPKVGLITKKNTNASPEGEPLTGRVNEGACEVVCQGNKSENIRLNTESAKTGKKHSIISIMPTTSSDKSKEKPDFRPLAERMRPQCIEDFVGQGELFGRNLILKKLISRGQVPSLILHGPPGSGKTTLASIIAKKMKEQSNIKLVKLSATTSNVAEVKKTIAEATNMQRMFKRKTVLFMDEIHRFNKLQQDTFLPFIENGTITLFGATTENPSFSLNSALLSRCQVIMLKKHGTEDLELILKKAAERLGVAVLSGSEDTSESYEGIYIREDAIFMLAGFCDGDARSALNILEMTVNSCSGGGPPNCGREDRTGNGDMAVITIDLIKDSLQRSHVQYDRTGDEHYNCISALHKSMRGCDADASLYWLGRMLIGGEDPLYVARRLIEFASCDIGLADPMALVQAVSTFQACQFLGKPVCEINLAQCVTYLARAPKSPEIDLAYKKVRSCITEHQGPMPGVPLHLRNAPSALMKNLGYGKGYDPSARQVYMPEGMEGVRFFTK